MFVGVGFLIAHAYRSQIDTDAPRFTVLDTIAADWMRHFTRFIDDITIPINEPGIHDTRLLGKLPMFIKLLHTAATAGSDKQRFLMELEAVYGPDVKEVVSSGLSDSPTWPTSEIFG